MNPNDTYMRDGFVYKAKRRSSTIEPWPFFFDGGDRITSDYGEPRPGSTPPYHTGIDYVPIVSSNREIHIAFSGTVRFASTSEDSVLGYYVQIIPSNGEFDYDWYEHMLPNLRVRTGQQVIAGDIVGTVGSTGSSTGPHLHYSITKNGVRVDPHPYLGR